MTSWTNWRLTGLVFTRSQAKGAARHIALEIASRAHRRDDVRDGWTFVSLRDLVTATGHTKKTVLSAITDLVQLGELEVQRGALAGPRDARQNRYRLRLEALTGGKATPLKGGENAPLDVVGKGGETAPLRGPLEGGNSTPLDDGDGRAATPLTVEKRPRWGGKETPLMVESSYSARAWEEPEEERHGIENDSPIGESAPASASATDLLTERTSPNGASAPGDPARAYASALKAAEELNRRAEGRS
jgi:hypothetical protein